jgi:hypothetical protein
MDRLWTALDVVRRGRLWGVTVGSPEATASALIRLMAEEEGGESERRTRT